MFHSPFTYTKLQSLPPHNLKSGMLVKFLVHWGKTRFSLSNGFARSLSTVFSCSFIEILGSTGAFSSANFGNFICSLFSQSSTSSTLRFPELWMPLCFKYSFNQGTGLQWKLLAAESAFLCPLSLAYMGQPSSQERASKNFERTLFNCASVLHIPIVHLMTSANKPSRKKISPRFFNLGF